MDRAVKQSISQFQNFIFHISKSLECNAEKTLQLKIKKKQNEYRKLYENRYKYIYIYIYIYIYTYIICDENDSK